MSFINPSNDFSKHKLDSSLFIGVVEDNDDPEKLQRLKIRIKEVFGSEISTDDLPWSSPLRSPMFGAGNNLSNFCVPLVGTTVIVTFHNGNVYSPIYVGSLYGNNDRLTDFETNYPNRYGFVDPNGSKLVVDTVDQTVLYHHVSDNKLEIFNDTGAKYTHPSGTYIEILPNGKIVMVGVDDADITITNDLNIQAENINITANTDISISSGGNTDLTVGGNYTNTVTGNYTASALVAIMSGSVSSTVSGGVAAVTGSTGLTLSGGSVSGTLDGSGINWTV